MYFRPIRLLKLSVMIICLTICIYQSVRLMINQPGRVFVTNRNIFQMKNQLEQETEILSDVSTNDFQEFITELDPFYIRLPNFSDEEAKNWFHNSTYYRINSKRCPNQRCDERGILFNQSKEHRFVRVAIVKNGLYNSDDCGYNYGDEAIRRQFTMADQIGSIYEQAILYTVPDGWSFQHFLDGIGPKLSHSRIYLEKYPNAKVIILRGARFDRSVKEIWSMLGVDESKRLVHYNEHTKLAARFLINPCRTPGIHPKLWQDARSLYWSISGLEKKWPDQSLRKNFIYIQRTSKNAMNGGRLILNEDAFVDVLRRYCSERSLNYIQYDHSKDSNHIRTRIELFYNARYIIGVHSGALSNMNFAQNNTTVIEIMPYRLETSALPMTCSMFRPDDLKACAGYILYTQSQLLNQSYWILPQAVNAEGNIQLNLNRIQTLLQQIQ